MVRWFKGDGLKARALRGTGLTILHLGGSNLLRLASNLLLTRLLFPEAFGLMALVQALVQGLKLLSDTGVVPSIVRSDRGDDPDFLNTAWTVQICRGMLLWALASALAWPLSEFYNEPLLAQILPVTGLSVLVSGFTTTKVATARRHLALGGLTIINLITQAVGILAMVILAWLLQSVWALAIGGLIGTVATVLAQHAFLPGIRNRLLWNKSAFDEIFRFGKFIFLSTGLSFVMNHGDKLVLGKYLSMAEFGIYNIGYLLASMPFQVSKALNNSVIFPLYRHRPIAESAGNRRHVFRARRLVIAGALTMVGGLGLVGVPLIELLYDPRYAQAGGVVVLMCFALVPQIMLDSYVSVFLSAGDSRSQFILVLTGAILQITLLIAAVQWAGTFGVILVPGVVNLLLSPLRIRLLRRHNGWDARGDMILSTYGFALTGLACWIYRDEVLALFS